MLEILKPAPFVDMAAEAELEAQPTPQPARTALIRKYLVSEIDPASCTGPLSLFCFMTGFL